MGKMIENYSLQCEIGRGMYSTVFKAINIKTKQEVAIKMVKAEKFKQYPKLQEGTYNEISILTNLEPCPYIIKYFDMLKTVNNFYFVYEFCNQGTLEKVLVEKTKLPEKTALTYFSCIIEAFKILNKHNIMHRDIKPENILLHDGIVKVADFGFCKPLESQDQTSGTMIGSPIYMAPEVLNGKQYTIKADIWSLGVVLFRMIYGFCPFQSGSIGKLIAMIEEVDLHFPKEPRVSPEVIKLMKRMITKNPEARADWAEVFSYQVKNGQLYLNPRRERTPKSGLKKSSTVTQTTKSSGLTQTADLGTARRLQAQTDGSLLSQKQGSQLIYNPNNNLRPYKAELRTTYSAKSPFRQNFKKDLMIKNHQKCIQIMTLGISLMSFEQPEALAISYYITKNVQRELNSILESARKESQMKNEEQLMRTMASVLETESAEIKCLIVQCREELRGELNMPVEMIQMRRKQLLKKLVGEMNKDRHDDLVVMSRVVDYMTEELVIRRETYQKMSSDKMLSNIRQKMQNH